MATLSPSDVKPRLASLGAATITVAGRVFNVEGNLLVLADAFARIAVEMAETPSAEPGDLLVLSARAVDGRLSDGAVLSRQPCPTPAASGEFFRLVFAGEAERLRDTARAAAVARAFFGEQDFVEVSTPLCVPAPGVDFHVDAIAAGDKFLITSPELEMKRLLVGGMPRIFQLARVARADEEGALHAPEFTMLEWYRAFADLEQVLVDTEQLVRRVVRELSGEDQVFVLGSRKVDVGPPFERITVREAFAAYAGVADAAELAARDEDRYFELLVSLVEPALALRPRPVFLTHYPISQAALSRPHPGDPSVAERAELYFGGVELCNAYGELTDPVEQRRRMAVEAERRRSLGRTVYPLDEPFLASLVEGMP
ncbi:MAG TPA: amino acid--tRNA ligase-related protein, partial [Polyangiaceae bacterium]|nr:amino acid--tRNA ligase-related protein [Polyangiaceae bacterium]